MLGILVEVIGIDVVFCKTARDSRAVVFYLHRRTLALEVVAVGQKAVTVSLGSDVGHAVVKGRNVRLAECRDGVSAVPCDVRSLHGKDVAADGDAVRPVREEPLLCLSTDGHEGTGIVRPTFLYGCYCPADVPVINNCRELELSARRWHDALEFSVMDGEGCAVH